MAINFFFYIIWRRRKAKLWRSSHWTRHFGFCEHHLSFLKYIWDSSPLKIDRWGAREKVWVSGFKWMRSFYSLPIPHTADVTRWEWILSLFWFPSYNPFAFSILPLGNLWSLQNHLTDNHSYRQQTHTLPHWNSLTQDLKALVYNRFKYKHVFLPFIIFFPSLRKPYVIIFWEATQSTAGGLYNWPAWGVAEVGFKRYWPYGFG